MGRAICKFDKKYFDKHVITWYDIGDERKVYTKWKL